MAIPARTHRILTVDDDSDFRGTLVEGLTEQGFDVRSAADGPSAVEAYLRDGADAIVLDLDLGGADGTTVCRELKELAGEAFLPVIFLTGCVNVRARLRALAEGADDLCLKPCSVEELSARLAILLRTRDRQSQLMSELVSLRRHALVDPLTGLGNRRAFDADLQREWACMERSGRPLAMLYADIDRFKGINDKHGHQAGDAILGRVGRAITRTIRTGDQAFRIGGEEFAILLPGTDQNGALVVAERILLSVMTDVVGPADVTISLGLSVAPGASVTSPDMLIEAADAGLYAAKRAGRNRVCSVNDARRADHRTKSARCSA